jgi:hypothetical protein
VSAAGRSRIRQREDLAGRYDAAQHALAQQHKRRGGFGSDRARYQHRPAKRPTETLQPADKVDRGTETCRPDSGKANSMEN